MPLPTDPTAAFEALVRHHRHRLLAAAGRILHDDEAARDAVGDAVGAAYRSLSSFRGEAQLDTWLHRIVVNAALMQRRRARRRRETSLDDLPPGFAADAGAAAIGARPDAELERKQLRQNVRRCIDRLSAVHRSVIMLRDIEERTTGETAAHLGISANAVKIRLHRARRALREQWQHGQAPCAT